MEPGFFGVPKLLGDYPWLIFIIGGAVVELFFLSLDFSFNVVVKTICFVFRFVWLLVEKIVRGLLMSVFMVFKYCFGRLSRLISEEI